MNVGDRLRILATISLRSLAAHRIKSLLVGGILFFGTFLVVTGGALLDSVEASMAKSITSSLSGHLQVYSADAEDPLALFGSFGGATEDIGEIPDYPAVERALLEVDGVRAVVPMGISIATVYGGNEIDKVLADLRAAVARGDADAVAVLSERVRRIADTIREDYDVRAEIANDPARVAADKEALTTATSDAFWQGFGDEPLPALDFLDARIAPLAADARFVYLRILGTDPDKFTASFDRFRIVDGEPIPPGHRGILLAKRTYEDFIKNIVARELDAIRDEVANGARIADDTLLQERIARNARQYQRIAFQLSPRDAAVVEDKLRALMPGVQGDLTALLQAFLTVDDSNLDARYRFFYDEIAPRIRLYELPVGETITLKAFTKTGYPRSVNVRVYGTYTFEGLEKSDLAGAANLTDLVTWRELYGKMSEAQVAELAQIREQVGVKDVDRDDAEAALFGGGDSPVVADAAPANDAFAALEATTDGPLRAVDSDTYTPEQLREGLALNAAVLLDDPARIDEVRAAIEDRVARDGLGLQVVDWQEASGIVGQFVVVMRAVLYTAIFVIFLVALVIINNAMVMATLERTPEIGTMRAIGAQRGFVMAMFLIETLVLGLLAGGLGAAAGAAFVTWLGQVGIPAPSEVLVVLFAGPRLFPSVGVGNLTFGIAVIVVVSVLSTLYPALVAARVAPVVAMQGKE